MIHVLILLLPPLSKLSNYDYNLDTIKIDALRTQDIFLIIFIRYNLQIRYVLNTFFHNK